MPKQVLCGKGNNMNEHFQKMEHPLNLLAPSEEIWKLLINAARETRQSALRLGHLLSQISQQRDHWLPKLGCDTLQEIAEKLGITDRKFRHLVSLSESWSDACLQLECNLPLPKNNLVASRIFASKNSLSKETYLSLLQRFYQSEEATLAICDELDALREKCVQEMKLSPKIRAKIRKTFLDVASMTAYDGKVVDEICVVFGKLEEPAKQKAYAGMASLIELLKKSLDATEAENLAAVEKIGEAVASSNSSIAAVWSYQTTRSN